MQDFPLFLANQRRLTVTTRTHWIHEHHRKQEEKDESTRYIEHFSLSHRISLPDFPHAGSSHSPTQTQRCCIIPGWLLQHVPKFQTTRSKRVKKFPHFGKTLSKSLSSHRSHSLSRATSTNQPTTDRDDDDHDDSDSDEHRSIALRLHNAFRHDRRMLLLDPRSGPGWISFVQLVTYFASISTRFFPTRYELWNSARTFSCSLPVWTLVVFLPAVLPGSLVPRIPFYLTRWKHKLYVVLYLHRYDY